MEKLTVEEIAAVVDNEGLDYAIQHYLSSDRIADPELAKLWQDAAAALSAVSSYLEEHTTEGDAGDDEESLAGLVSVSYEQILCDEPPAMFDGKPTDEYDYAQIVSPNGGTLRLNLSGGRWGSDPEVYVKGSFEAPELLGLLRELAPSVATHISQSVRIDDDAGERWYASFRNGSVEI